MASHAGSREDPLDGGIATLSVTKKVGRIALPDHTLHRGECRSQPLLGPFLCRCSCPTVGSFVRGRTFGRSSGCFGLTRGKTSRAVSTFILDPQGAVASADPCPAVRTTPDRERVAGAQRRVIAHRCLDLVLGPARSVFELVRWDHLASGACRAPGLNLDWNKFRTPHEVRRNRSVRGSTTCGAFHPRSLSGLAQRPSLRPALRPRDFQ